MESASLQERAKCPTNFTLTAGQVHRCATAILQDHLKLPDHGPRPLGPLLTLLFYAAAFSPRSPMPASVLPHAPSDEAARLALIATLPDFAELPSAGSTPPWPATCPGPCAGGRSAWPPTWS